MTSTSLEERVRAAIHPTYYLVRKIGAGGMGTVYLALDPAVKRAVAVKVLEPELADSQTRARFERESQAVSVLDHPSIVQMLAVGQLDDEIPYMVMQYVAGPTLKARLDKSGPFAITEARRIIADVAAGLAAAHEKGIIHRDIKPDNVLFDDELGRALISDFGIAAVRKGMAGVRDVKLTATGSSIGTPGYMSPEAMLAEPLSDRTDIYALGLLAFELLAGRPAFVGKTQHALIMAHLTEIPPRLSTIRPEIDGVFDDTIAACLAKDAIRRPSAADVAARLS